MRVRDVLRPGAKTSKTRRPPGRNSSRAARSARRRSCSVAMCRSERNGIRTSGTRSGTGGSRRSPSRRSSSTPSVSAYSRDLEHRGRGVDADHLDAGLRDREDPPGAAGELDHRPAGRTRLLDVEADVLRDARAPRVVEPRDRVVRARAGATASGQPRRTRSRSRRTAAGRSRRRAPRPRSPPSRSGLPIRSGSATRARSWRRSRA